MARFNSSTIGKEVVQAFPEEVAGRVFVITGASVGGMGAQVAQDLAAARPAAIILLGRNQATVDPVLERVRKASPSTDARFVPVDLASYDSVCRAAEEIKASVPKVDVLINNAGVMGIEWDPSPAGVEGHFAANHLGHYLLTKLLAPALEASDKGARVVNVSSQMYQLSAMRFDDFNFGGGYKTWEAYGQSKTANILFAVALAGKAAAAGSSIKAFSLHPGAVMGTNLYAGIDPAEYPVVGALMAAKKMAQPKEKTVEQGSATTLAAALDPSLDGFSGAFLDDCLPAETLEYASSAEEAEKLWALSETLIAGAKIPASRSPCSWW